MNISQLLRPEVKDFEPYLPGKPIDELKSELGLKKVIKLASNENALGTSKKVIAALRKNSNNLFRYPEGPGTLLRRSLAKRLQVDESEIILGAGSDELIELIGKTFFNCEDEIIISEHAFIRYKMAVDLMGAKAVIVPMKNYTHDLAAMAEKVNSQTKAIFIANPNNPTGTYVNRKVVSDFFAFLKTQNSQRKILIVFDEAYYEFSKNLVPDYPETIEYFKQGLDVVILRTFSKIYGLAGLRVGYAIARKEVIEVLDRVRPPFNVSSIAQIAAQVALSDSLHVEKSIEVVKKGIQYLTNELNKLNIKTIPSAGNFLMLDCSPMNGRELFEKLLKKGVIVRAIDEYGFPNHVRVTIGLPEENQFFIQQLKKVIQERI